MLRRRRLPPGGIFPFASVRCSQKPDFNRPRPVPGTCLLCTCFLWLTFFMLVDGLEDVTEGIGSSRFRGSLRPGSLRSAWLRRGAFSLTLLTARMSCRDCAICDTRDDALRLKSGFVKPRRPARLRRFCAAGPFPPTPFPLRSRYPRFARIYFSASRLTFFFLHANWP